MKYAFPVHSGYERCCFCTYLFPISNCLQPRSDYISTYIYYKNRTRSTDRRRLRSADVDTCCVPRTNTRFGDQSFAAAGPRLWNSLPARIRQPDNDIGEFRRQQKSYLFKWHRGAYSDCVFTRIL